jgi:hypothetical protein
MKDILQHKKYPCLMSLYIILNEDKEIKHEKLIDSNINEYDSTLKQIYNSNLSISMKKYLLELVKFEFKDNRSLYIKEKYRTFYKNYIVAKYRNYFKLLKG